MSFHQTLELSIVLPCRNESQALAKCIEEINLALAPLYLTYEIVVSDSSTDSCAEIALARGCTVVPHGLPGYGTACLKGMDRARGTYLIVADADWSYDFKEIPAFYEALKAGFDLVIGERTHRKMDSKSMPVTHKYLGNPVLSFVLRKLFRSSIRDSQCGFRGLTKSAMSILDLRCQGMEFASEMIVQAELKGLKITQIPISYRCRLGKSKMRPLRDGTRHLRFLFSTYMQNHLDFKAWALWRTFSKR